jgi:tetratricopeptide (TPR) repeat protein
MSCQCNNLRRANIVNLFYFQKLSKKIIYSIKVSILLIFFIGLYSLNTESAYAYNIFQFFSNNSVFRGDLRADLIVRIDKGFVAHLSEYQDNQSSNISQEGELLNIGLEQLERENFKDAIKSFTRSLQFNPNFAKAYTARAYARGKMEQRQTSLEDYDRALEIDPKLVDAYIGRGNIYFKQDDNQSAIRDFKLAISVNPNYDDAFFSRGSVYLEMGQYNEAIKDFSEAISLNPQHMNAYLQRGYSNLTLVIIKE